MTQAKQKDLLGRTEPQQTAPVPREPAPLAVPQEDIGLSGQYDKTDWVVPSLFVVQPTSQDFPDAKPGQFAMRDGRVADSLIVVPLRIAATRAMWPAEMSEGRSPLCASNDRVHGRPFGDAEGGEVLCQECGHYSDEPWDGNGDPKCLKGYALLVAIQDFDDDPAIIRIKGTSVSPVKQRLLAHFQPRPGRTPRPVWTRVFTLTTELVKSAKGTFYILVPKLVGDVEDDAQYAALARHLAGVSVEAVEEEPPFEEEGQEEPFE